MNLNHPLFAILIWAIFGLQHSFFAQKTLKTKLNLILGNVFEQHFYRLFYFLTQILAYGITWNLLKTIDEGHLFFKIEPQYDVYPYGLRLVGKFLILATFMRKDMFEFIGIKQVLTFFLKGRFADLFSSDVFSKSFPYNLVRHPLYLGIILSFLGSSNVISEKFIINLIAIVAYIYVGSFFEEKQLVRSIGEPYLVYQKEVPRILPIKW
jgi:hypothetical protein